MDLVKSFWFMDRDLLLLDPAFGPSLSFRLSTGVNTGATFCVDVPLR